LPTVGGRSEFTLSSIGNDRLDWTVSTKKLRYSVRNYIQRYLQHYAMTKSFRPVDYKGLKLTEASYILTLIRLYLKHHSEDEG